MIAKKKSKKADLEGKRFAFFQIGLVVAGALTLAAFEYSSIKFEDLVKRDGEIELFASIQTEQPKELIVSQQKIKLKITLPVIDDEVKQVDELKDDLVSDKVDKDIIDEFEIDGTGTDDGELGGVIFTPTDDDGIIDVPSVMPEFPGGLTAMNKWIANNIDVPYYAEKMSGTIYIEFVVSKDGNIKHVKLSNKLSYEYDKAALAVVSKMPKWTPGEQAGKHVNVRYHLPIKFVKH